MCLLWFTLHKYFVIWEAIVKIKLNIHISVVFWFRYVIKTCNVLLHLFYKHITCEYINSLNHTVSLILSEATSWCLSRAVTNLHIEAELLCSQHYNILTRYYLLVSIVIVVVWGPRGRVAFVKMCIDKVFSLNKVIIIVINYYYYIFIYMF